MSSQSFLMALRSEKAAPGLQRRWRGLEEGAGFLDLLWCFAEILPTQCFGGVCSASAVRSAQILKVSNVA